MSDPSTSTNYLPELLYDDLLNQTFRVSTEKSTLVDETSTDEEESSPKKMEETEKQYLPPIASEKLPSKSVKRKASSHKENDNSSFLQNYEFKFLFANKPHLDDKNEKECDTPPTKRQKIYSTEPLKVNLEANTTSSETSFGCIHEGCDAVFPIRAYLTAHVRRVHSSPVKCPFADCNRMLKAYYVATHVKKVHEKAEEHCVDSVPAAPLEVGIEGTKDEITFVCPFDGCKAAFAKKNFLDRHKHRVHVSPVKCPYENCEKFLKPSYLSSHIKNIHKKLE